jgi:diguanylate cyclase (GGDEF)-like protein
MPAGELWYQVVAEGGGHYESPGALANQGPTLVSVHLLQNYPFVVDVGRNRAKALQRWQRQAIAIAAGVLSATISLALLLRALTRQIAVSIAAEDLISRQMVALGASEALLATTFEHMNQGLVMIDAAGMVAVCNGRAAEILDLPPEMMAAHPRATDVLAYQVQRNDFAEPAEPPVDMALIMGNRATYKRRRPNGTVIEVTTTPLPDGGMVPTFTDITARAAAEAMLGLAASHDQLTGLTNRYGFNTRLEAALAATRRDSTELAALCLDLDCFRAVNDTLGHGDGDQLLILVAQRMREITGGADILGRLGGDEFAMVLPGSDMIGAAQVARRLLEAIRLPYSIGREMARVGVSIGHRHLPRRRRHRRTTTPQRRHGPLQGRGRGPKRLVLLCF